VYLGRYYVLCSFVPRESSPYVRVPKSQVLTVMEDGWLLISHSLLSRNMSALDDVPVLPTG
jgi:hypothetical protein